MFCVLLEPPGWIINVVLEDFSSASHSWGSPLFCFLHLLIVAVFIDSTGLAEQKSGFGVDNEIVLSFHTDTSGMNWRYCLFANLRHLSVTKQEMCKGLNTFVFGWDLEKWYGVLAFYSF